MDSSQQQQNSAGTKNHVDVFEEAFHSVCKYLDLMDEKKVPQEDSRKDAEVLVTQLLDSGRACEQFFLQKHLQIAHAKPEQTLEEECNELKSEINKKELAISKHHDKLQIWQQILRGPPSAPQMAGRPHATQPLPAAYAVQGQPLVPSGQAAPPHGQVSHQHSQPGHMGSHTTMVQHR